MSLYTVQGKHVRNKHVKMSCCLTPTSNCSL